MNPTALKLGADVAASDPALQVGPGLLVFAAVVLVVGVLLWYFDGYDREGMQ